MEKRYQIFISSTFEDLREERSAVIQALLELDSIPAGMEMFPASDDDQWSLIQQVIDDCDYYIIIVGGRYGSVTTEGISYTEREFDYAVSKNIPILAFTHKSPDSLSRGKSEIGEAAVAQLQKFREKVRTKRLVREWSSPEDLGGQVSRSLVKAIKSHPAEGWVRARHAATPALLEQLNELKDEKQKLTSIIEQLQSEAPKGTEEYASGTDEFEVSGVYQNADTPHDKFLLWATMSNWDEIFSTIDPLMFNEASEAKLKEMLSDFFFQRSKKGHEEWLSASNLKVYANVWHTVLVQLRALGLIQKSAASHNTNDTDAHWALTPYGEEQLTKLRAIKKGSQRAKETESMPDVIVNK